MSNNNEFYVKPLQEDNPKLETKLIPNGPNPCILYSITQIGNHFKTFKGVREERPSNMVMLTFEFPLLKQLFRQNDKEPRPSVLTIEEKFFLTERSNLTKICQGMLGRNLTPEELKNGVNIGQFLGKAFIANVKTTVSKNGKTYQSLINDSFQPITEQLKSVYNFDWVNIKPHNEISTFSLADVSTCFKSKKYAFLPNWIKNKIKESEEAKNYIEGGGTFAERKDFNEDSQQPPVQFQGKQNQPQQGGANFPELDNEPTGQSFM